MSRNARPAAERIQGQVQHSQPGSGRKSDPPVWVKPQLTELVKQPPDGPDGFHEIKFDGYRIHARIDHGDVRLLTRTGLDWTRKYLPIAAALEKLPVETAYLDGELCGVDPDGTTSFSIIQAASDSGNADVLVFFPFDLLFLEGEDLTGLPLSKRKSRLATVMSGVAPPLHYSDHQVGHGPIFYAEACKLGLEGIGSKRADTPYVPGNRGLWLKTKCLNREEFVVVGWTKRGERLFGFGIGIEVEIILHQRFADRVVGLDPGRPQPPPPDPSHITSPRRLVTAHVECSRWSDGPRVPSRADSGHSWDRDGTAKVAPKLPLNLSDPRTLLCQFSTLVTACFFFDFRPIDIGVGCLNGLVEAPQCVRIGFRCAHCTSASFSVV
jgi:ATP dependent DNA ligase domain